MKKKILITIDSLTSGGAEKSLISLLTLFDYDKYDVDLLLFYQRGLYLPLIPKEVNVIEPPGFLKRINKGMKSNLVQGDLKALYLRMGLSISCRNPLMTKKYHGAQIIYKWLSKGIENLDKEYDVAIAYSQGMPTYYVSQKVKAKRKLAWMNIDYKVAGYNKDFDIKYYNKFDKVVAVSHSCKDVLIKEIPSLENKVEIIYDIISSKLIENMANEKGGFSDEFDGIKILTIGRLVHQKGYEMAIEAAYKLKQDKINFKWYAIGEGKLKEKFENVEKIYLEPNKIFNTKSNNEISNFEETLQKYGTENFVTEVKSNLPMVIEMKNNKYYITNGGGSREYNGLDGFENVKVSDNSITATLKTKQTGPDASGNWIDKEDKKSEIKLVKNGNTWLIDEINTTDLN